MSESGAEPVQARPWLPSDGRQPVVRTWPRSDPPALWVWAGGCWRWATVMARQDWPDGRIAYQVAVDLDGSTAIRIRSYWWPHEGLRVAHRGAAGLSRAPLDDDAVAAKPSGQPGLPGRGMPGAELGSLSVDVTALESHRQLLRNIGTTDAAHLRSTGPGQKVLVAGVRAATQTPPTPGERRMLFVTLADGSGLVDVTFAADPHEDCAQTVFRSELLLVHGTLDVHGRRLTVAGEKVWDLQEVAEGAHDELRHIAADAASPQLLQAERSTHGTPA